MVVASEPLDIANGCRCSGHKPNRSRPVATPCVALPVLERRITLVAKDSAPCRGRFSMTDNGSANGADGLRYNRRGYLIPPQSEGGWAALTGIFAMIIPLIATRTTFRSPFPSVILQKLAIFQLAIAHNLLVAA